MTGSLVEILASSGVPDQYDVTPGLPGFLATFAVVIVFLVLIRSFNKNMRKVNANERHRRAATDAAATDAAGDASEREAEAAEVDEAESTGVTGSEVPESEVPEDVPEAGRRE